MKRRRLLIIEHKLRQKTGQAALELSVAIICLLILAAASVKLFIWVNRSIIQRNADYESGEYGRVEASNYTNPIAGIKERNETLILTR